MGDGTVDVPLAVAIVRDPVAATLIGSVNNPAVTPQTNQEGANMRAIYSLEAGGNWKLHTMDAKPIAD